jgi:hypothetical protein
MFTIYRNQLRPSLTGTFCDQISGGNENFFTGQGNFTAGVDGGKCGCQRCCTWYGHAYNVTVCGCDFVDRSCTHCNAITFIPGRQRKIGYAKLPSDRRQTGNVVMRNGSNQLEMAGEFPDQVTSLAANRACGTEQNNSSSCHGRLINRK